MKIARAWIKDETRSVLSNADHGEETFITRVVSLLLSAVATALERLVPGPPTFYYQALGHCCEGRTNDAVTITLSNSAMVVHIGWWSTIARR